MIKYFAYYSYGGFKDMLAGSQAEKAERTYYLPLVESGIDTDQTKKDLPRIKILDDDDEGALTGGIIRLVSNGGYDIFYSRNFDGKSVLVIRDINGTEKDDNGRSIPFVMELIGDDSDSEVLAKAASFLMNNTGSSDKILGSLFHYDPVSNGLCFENKKLSDWLTSINGSTSMIETVDKGTVNLYSGNTASFISVKVKTGKDEFLNRLGLADKDVLVERYDRILPENDTNLRNRRVAAWKEYEAAIRRKKLMYAAITGGIVIAGILLACLLTKCD